ncbi:MAG: peptidoglycan DD-metalloendopeptidase family protein [Timaviella obliquedivisa GSE-PSE-MK23-08B]|nr:peptidoglycan DD-metalloendopeptidase family protein [Timaviella obliquedivisa GSE-PSE-MK23-08B]
MRRLLGERWLVFALSLVFAFFLINVGSSVVPVIAQTPLDQLQKQQSDLERQRSTVTEQRDRIQRQEASAQTKLGGIQIRIKATTAQISANEKKLQNASQRLNKLQINLASVEAGYQQKQFATIARLKFLQRQQHVQGWAVLLQSQNLNEFLDRRYQIQQVYKGDRQTLVTLKAQSNKIETQRRAVSTQKNTVALLTQELLAQKSEFQAEADTQKTNIDRLKQDQGALEAAEEQLSRDSENIAALIQQRLAEQSRSNIAAVLPSTGLMGYPSNGPITSPFGDRMHPILGYVRFHSGLDFGADYGSPIFAAQSGTVILAGWYGGYGQAVLIDHGGVTTLYGHSSELYVAEGDTVQRGQAIAAIGSSGLSTGPHLHFEVRVSGEPVNPISYF